MFTESTAPDGGISFRWRGRSQQDGKFIPNTLASGLDDYPRSLVVSDQESHLDLLCWIARAARIMASIQRSLPEPPKDAYDFEALAGELIQRIDTVHWSEEHSGYFDVGVHSETSETITEVGVRCAVSDSSSAPHQDFAITSTQTKPSNNGDGSAEYECPTSHPHFVRLLLDPSTNRPLTRSRRVASNLTVQHVPRIGYVSLFPLLLKLLAPDNPRLGAVLDMMENPALLWSDFGIRSLSASDPYYRKNNAQHDTPYWR